MAPPREPVTLRPARPEDVHGMMLVGDAAFGRFNGLSRLLFPESLTPDPAKRWENELAWRSYRVAQGLTNPRRHYLLAEAADGSPAGWAGWERPKSGGAEGEAVPAPTGGDGFEPPKSSMSPEALRRAEEAAKAAPGGEGVSWEGMQHLGRVVEAEEERLFGKDGVAAMWTLFALSVHPDHQRKGIGRRLLDWGIEHARQDGKDIYLMAKPAGKALYLGAGFEEIGFTGAELIGVDNYHMILRASGETRETGAAEKRAEGPGLQ